MFTYNGPSLKSTANFFWPTDKNLSLAEGVLIFTAMDKLVLELQKFIVAILKKFMH